MLANCCHPESKGLRGRELQQGHLCERGAGELGTESCREKRLSACRVGSDFYIEVYLTIKNGTYLKYTI